MVCNSWLDYKILDVSKDQKLEQVGIYKILRPVFWGKGQNIDLLSKYSKSIDIYFDEKNSKWSHLSGKDMTGIDLDWVLKWKDFEFLLKPSSTKQIGIFPEQAINWDIITNVLNNLKSKYDSHELNVLNLFGYTGAASVVASKHASRVVHIDSSSSAMKVARANAERNSSQNIYFFEDDVLKFVNREIKKKAQYDVIILDPPSFGRGTKGEIWKIERDLQELLIGLDKLTPQNRDSYILLNTYTLDLGNRKIHSIINNVFGKNVLVDVYELELPIENSDDTLSCGYSFLIKLKNR